MEMTSELVQNTILSLDKTLKIGLDDKLSNEDLYIKKILERRSIFSKDLSLIEKLYYEVDKLLNSFSSSSDKEKFAIIIIKMMILILTKKENKTLDDLQIIIDLYNQKVEDILKHLLDKNRKYGNSALNPIRIVSSENTVEQLYIRIDDKLNRVINRQNDEDEDLPFDIAGYFILVYIYYQLSK
jgi:hypothetical protein